MHITHSVLQQLCMGDDDDDDDDESEGVPSTRRTVQLSNEQVREGEGWR